LQSRALTSSPALFLQAAALIDLARARLFLGEDMEGEARSFRCALHQFGSNNLQPNARLVKDHAFSLDDFRQVPKVGDDGIIQVRQAGKSWTSGFVGWRILTDQWLLHFWNQFD